MKKHNPCLILNQDYTPLTIINWKRAICLEIIGKEMPGEGISILEYYENDHVESAGGKVFLLPAVAIINRFIKRKRLIPLRRQNILIRDKYTCQYCGIKISQNSATIDHIKPKSHFKNKEEAHSWENLVAACNKCNSKKEDKTLSQANMKLLNNPKEPSPSQFYSEFVQFMPREWELYVRNKKMR